MSSRATVDMEQTIAKTYKHTYCISFLSLIFYPLPHTRSVGETRSFVSTLISFTSTHSHLMTCIRSAHTHTIYSSLFLLALSICLLSYFLCALGCCDLVAVHCPSRLMYETIIWLRYRYIVRYKGNYISVPKPDDSFIH